MKYERVGNKLKQKAKETNIISYLKARHPKTIQFAGHPDETDYICWRGVKHDSITFYSHQDSDGNTIFRYKRHSTGETDDGIGYLINYEQYSFNNAVKALAYFQCEDEELDTYLHQEDTCSISKKTEAHISHEPDANDKLSEDHGLVCTYYDDADFDREAFDELETEVPVLVRMKSEQVKWADMDPEDKVFDDVAPVDLDFDDIEPFSTDFGAEEPTNVNFEPIAPDSMDFYDTVPENILPDDYPKMGCPL